MGVSENNLYKLESMNINVNMKKYDFLCILSINPISSGECHLTQSCGIPWALLRLQPALTAPLDLRLPPRSSLVIHVYIYTYVYICMYIYIYICVHIYIYICTYMIYVHIWYMYIYDICTYMIYVHISIYIYIYYNHNNNNNNNNNNIYIHTYVPILYLQCRWLRPHLLDHLRQYRSYILGSAKTELAKTVHFVTWRCGGHIEMARWILIQETVLIGIDRESFGALEMWFCCLNFLRFLRYFIYTSQNLGNIPWSCEYIYICVKSPIYKASWWLWRSSAEDFFVLFPKNDDPDPGKWR